MENLEQEIRELAEMTAFTRHQFLRAELETCGAALEMAQYEMTMGNTPLANRELDVVGRGIRVIERFLREVSGEQRAQLEIRLAKLKAEVKVVTKELALGRGGVTAPRPRPSSRLLNRV